MLEPALRSYLRRRCVGTLLEMTPTARGQRFAPRVEAAVYFAATRALGSGHQAAAVTLGVDSKDLHCTVSGAEPSPLDVQGIGDRVEAVGGVARFSCGSLEIHIPLAAIP